MSWNFYTRRFTDVLEGAVAAIAIEFIELRLVRKRTGIGIGIEVELIIRIEGEVIGNKQVEVTVVIRVKKNRADAGAAFVGHACLFGEVFEGAVAAIVIEVTAADTGHKKVGVAVVIIISRNRGSAIPCALQSSLVSNVFKSAVATIAIEAVGFARGPWGLMRDSVEWTGINKVKIHQAVAVVINPGAPGAIGFQDVGDF